MASLFKRSGSFYTLQFNFGGKRRTLRLPTKQKKNANEIKEHIERMLDFKSSGIAFDLRTLRWIDDQPAEFRQRIAATDLIDSVNSISTVDELVEYYKNNFIGDNEKTKDSYEYVFDKLRRCFGEKRSIASISQGDAEEYVFWLLKHGSADDGPLAKGSVGAMLVKTKTIFGKAVRKNWLTSNPFEGLRAGTSSNEDLIRYISPGEFNELTSLFGNSPTEIELKLILALGRWGGLRIPSEPRELRWDLVDFDNNRFKFYATKTKSHRVVPIFPELRPFLKEMLSVALDSKFVCPNIRKYSRTWTYGMVENAVKNSEMARWPRLLQNLRTSRSNEIEREYGSKIESAWIGHSSHIAKQNYFSVSESDFERAASSESNLAKIIGNSERLDSELSKLSAGQRKTLVTALKKIKKQRSSSKK